MMAVNSLRRKQNAVNKGRGGGPVVYMVQLKLAVLNQSHLACSKMAAVPAKPMWLEPGVPVLVLVLVPVPVPIPIPILVLILIIILELILILVLILIFE